MGDHHVRVETSTWKNTPPYPATTMHRANCKCGWQGQWFRYRENVENKCPNA